MLYRIADVGMNQRAAITTDRVMAAVPFVRTITIYVDFFPQRNVFIHRVIIIQSIYENILCMNNVESQTMTGCYFIQFSSIEQYYTYLTISYSILNTFVLSGKFNSKLLWYYKSTFIFR